MTDKTLFIRWKNPVDQPFLRAEKGISLLETLIAMAIFSLFVIGLLYVFEASGVRVTADHQLLSMHMADRSLTSLLATSSDTQNWNGATFTANSETGVPSSAAALDKQTLADIQNALMLASNHARITLIVHPDDGTSVCPCSVQENNLWRGETWSTASQTRY